MCPNQEASRSVVQAVITACMDQVKLGLNQRMYDLSILPAANDAARQEFAANCRFHPRNVAAAGCIAVCENGWSGSVAITLGTAQHDFAFTVSKEGEIVANRITGTAEAA